MAELGLMVLRASDPLKTRRFYESLGLSFQMEQHEKGVLHYSCALGSTILEIYPGKPGASIEANSGGATMIGLRMGDVDSVYARAIEAGAKSRRAPTESPYGRRAVLEDPDGRVVEIT
jgi:predicted enzyme related to lactoylglutathione lyase